MNKREVVLVDVKILFWTVVFLMVKWAVAAIPAFIILYVLTFLLTALPNFIPRP